MEQSALKEEQSALKPDLFASQRHLEKLASLGDPLVGIASEINFGALAKAGGKKEPRPSKAQGGRRPYPSAERSDGSHPSP